MNYTVVTHGMYCTRDGMFAFYSKSRQGHHTSNDPMRIQLEVEIGATAGQAWLHIGQTCCEQWKSEYANPKALHIRLIVERVICCAE